MKIDNPEYEICLCRRIKVKDLEEIIRQKKYSNLKELCENEHIGDKCGGCREEIQQLLDKITVDF